MNKAEIVRKWVGKDSFIGEFYLGGEFQCFTLEPKALAIPEGTYSLTITYSPRFKKDMPLISGVKNRKGIRIHVGNIAADSEGCILVGLKRGDNWITGSKLAYSSLYPKLELLTEPGPLPIQVTSLKDAAA